MHLVVGLGNPGVAYRATRHNVGFLLIDELAARWRIELEETSPSAECGVGLAGAVAVVLAKPTTFMNASGDAVAALRRGYAADSVVVAYDDLDLPLGRLRIRPDGGAGGHRGVASIIAAIETDFVRVRIGIGRPPAGVDPVAFVLAPFAAEERDALQQALVRAADGIETLLRDGVEAAMRACNPPPVES
jgi:PTH1 family peptidyl-tRNA hydrolase